MVDEKDKKQPKKKKWWVSSLLAPIKFLAVLLLPIVFLLLVFKPTPYYGDAEFRQNLLETKKYAAEVIQWNYKDVKSVNFNDENKLRYNYNAGNFFDLKLLALDGHVNHDYHKNFTVNLTDSGDVGFGHDNNTNEIEMDPKDQKALKNPGIDWNGNFDIDPITVSHYEIQELKKQGFTENITGDQIREYKLQKTFDEKDPEIRKQKIGQAEQEAKELMEWNFNDIKEVKFLDEYLEFDVKQDKDGNRLSRIHVYGYMNGEEKNDFEIYIDQNFKLNGYRFDDYGYPKKMIKINEFKLLNRAEIEDLKTRGYDKNITKEEILKYRQETSFIDQDSSVVESKLAYAKNQAEELVKWNLIDVDQIDFSDTRENKYFGKQEGAEITGVLNGNPNYKIVIKIEGDYQIESIKLKGTSDDSFRNDEHFDYINPYDDRYDCKYLTYNDIQNLKARGYDRNISEEEIEGYKRRTSFVDQDSNLISANINVVKSQIEELFKWNLKDVRTIELAPDEENAYFGRQNGAQISAYINGDPDYKILIWLEGDYEIKQIGLGRADELAKVDKNIYIIDPYEHDTISDYLTLADIQYLKTQGYDQNITGKEIENCLKTIPKEEKSIPASR